MTTIANAVAAITRATKNKPGSLKPKSPDAENCASGDFLFWRVCFAPSFGEPFFHRIGHSIETGKSSDSIVLFVDLNQFDTGFQSLYEPGYKMRIFNRFTQSVYFVDIATWFSEDAFDEKGVALVKENIEVRPFYSCKAKYSDTSGKFELHCMQEVRLGGHIGDVYTVIEYNEMDKMFEVIKSDFLRG